MYQSMNNHFNNRTEHTYDGKVLHQNKSWKNGSTFGSFRKSKFIFIILVLVSMTVYERF